MSLPVGAKAMKIIVALSVLIVAISFCGFHAIHGCFPSVPQTPRRFCRKERSWLETTECVDEEELKDKIPNDDCILTCVKSQPTFSLTEPCIMLGFFTVGFGEHAPFGLEQFLTRPYMEYTAAYLESFGEALIALCEGIDLANYRLDSCSDLCGRNGKSDSTMDEDTNERHKKILEVLDALEITVETLTNTTDSLNEESDFKKFEADITDQLKYNDLMVQTYLMAKLLTKAESGKKLFTKILIKKAEGKHGIHWVLWMWDELIRYLIQKRPDMYCPKVPAYLIKQLKMRNVATFVKVRQAASSKELEDELENLNYNFKKTQEGQDLILKQNCLVE